MRSAALLFALVAVLPRGGFLGLSVRTADGGVLVLRAVEAGSGIEAGDLITKINDHVTTTSEDFVAFARTLHAGDVATIQLRRGNESLTKNVTVKPRPFEKSPDAEVSYGVVATDNGLRRVIVTAPKSEGRHPAVLYVTGIGCFSQESLDLSSSDAKLLYGLTRRGFVTMRVEKSRMGDSQGPPCQSAAADLQNEMNGYIAGLKALRQYPFVDPERVFIVGISIGGVEAPVVAKQEPVHGIVVINTVGKPFLEYLLDTRRRQMQLAHTPFDEIDASMRAEEICNHRFLIEKQTPDESCRERTAFPAPATYMQQWAAMSPAANWKAVGVPVLIVYGTSDYVATQADSPYLAAILDSFHPGQATLQAINGMDHNMLKAESMEASMNRKGAGEFAADVVGAIGSWLAAHS
jgi:pimeloyl-ACP methyl ester carboxylesterase